MGPYNNFAIIDNVNNDKDYSTENISEYNVVSISDEYVNEWVTELGNMNTFWHKMSRPNFGLARYGITLIPPESLTLFQSVVNKSVHIEQVKKLLELIEKAVKNDKYIIHFGI